MKSCVYLGNKEVGGVDLFWEGLCSPQYLNPRPGIVQPDVKLETGEGAGGASLAPAGACEIERLHGEWRAVVRLMSGCFGNRASSWGMAGFEGL